MRIALAGFALEAVTFLPGETTLAMFEANALRGEEALRQLAGTASVPGGMIDACRAADVEPVPIVFTDGDAGPNASEEAFSHYLEEIARGVLAEGTTLDGLVLFLHGAMVTGGDPATTTGRLDAETEFLRELRARIGPHLPITVAMDLHGNLHPDMLHHVLAVYGYHHSPHIDQAATGARAVRGLVAALRGETRPVCMLHKANVVLPSIFTATALEPLAAIMRAARAWEQRPGVLDVSVFTGFAYADVPQIGFSVVVVTDDDAALANEAATDLCGQIEQLREDLYKRELVLSVEQAVARAKEIAADPARRGPAVILEHADRGNDSTYVLRALLAGAADGEGAALKTRVAVPYLCDPMAVRAAMEAGEGATVTLEVGGRSSDKAGGPVTVTGRVRFAGEKTYLGTGPMRKGKPVSLGHAAVIETEGIGTGGDAGGITLILTSRSLSAIDLDPFVQFGLDVADFGIVVLRSKTHFRAVYEPLAHEILIADTPDWGPADLKTLPYRHARQGVFPLTS